MPTSNIKDEARQILDGLPDDATWEDLQYQIYVRQAIEAGLKDAREGKTITVEEVRHRLGLRSS
jgi:predicted transcriptional regulator